MIKYLGLVLVLVGCGKDERDYLEKKRSCLVGVPGNALCINDLDKEGCDQVSGLHGNQAALGCDLKNSGTCKLFGYELVFLGDVSDQAKAKWCSSQESPLVQ